MSSIKSPGIAILGLSLALSTLPIPIRAEAAPDATKGAIAHHVELVFGDESCDDPTERAVFLGLLADPRNAFVADPDEADDDDDQGDQLGSAPVAVDSDLVQPYDPRESNAVILFDVVARGKKTLLAVFSRAGPAVGPVPEEEPGKASLLLQGFRVAAQRPRFEVESGRRPVGLNASIATDRDPLPEACCRPLRGSPVAPPLSAPRTLQPQVGPGYCSERALCQIPIHEVTDTQ